MRSKVGRYSLHTFLFTSSILMLIPMFWMINMSFKSTNEIITSSAFALPEKFSFANYVDAWFKGHIGEYFFNSVFVTFVSTTFIIIFGSMAAYALSRMRWKFKDLFINAILLGMMIPIHATLIPVFITLKYMKLLNSSLCLILPYIASGLPMAIYIFRNFMLTIPKEMEEAANIDGCGVIRTFIFIILPNIRSAIITVIILTFMRLWNEFVLASVVIQKRALNTLPIGLQTFQTEFGVNWGGMAAGVVVSILPVFITYMIFNDMIDKSIVSGALK